jgi:hypothetical protein
MARTQLSVVVVVHDMAREAPRTLLSLSSAYQRNIAAQDYEVIVVDNGSRAPLGPEAAAGLEGQFRFLRIEGAPSSPAHAINRGLSEAQGEVVGVLIDGARILSPRVLHFALCGARLHARAIVATLGWYLGADFQAHAVAAGYDAAQEDALLESIHWPTDGYRLFDISTPDESSWDGALIGTEHSGGIYESTALFASRETWRLLGGVEERFVSAGGGLLNLDTCRRALQLPDARLVLLLGEGTFHQVHGGIATNAPPARFQERYRQWVSEYCAIRGAPFETPVLSHPPTFVGALHRSALTGLACSVIGLRRTSTPCLLEAPFDPWHFPEPASGAVMDPSTAALTNLMRQEFDALRYDAVACIARLMRARWPRAPQPWRLLRWLAPYDDRRLDLRERDARFHLAIGKAHRLLEDEDRARAEFRTALARDPTLEEARLALAESLQAAPA